MIAMQYRFVFPADYDMQIIRDRIANKGHVFDGFPGLIFKTFLHASKGVAPTNASDNLYAPFYIWENNDAMNRFLTSPAFITLCHAFGRPEIKVWSVWGQHLPDHFAEARYATIESIPITTQSPMRAVQESENAAIGADVDAGALAAISAFEPGTWTLLRFRLWKHIADTPTDHVQRYELGYVATGSRPDA
jgi:hypothetical protein